MAGSPPDAIICHACTQTRWLKQLLHVCVFIAGTLKKGKGSFGLAKQIHATFHTILLYMAYNTSCSQNKLTMDSTYMYIDHVHCGTRKRKAVKQVGSCRVTIVVFNNWPVPQEKHLSPEMHLTLNLGSLCTWKSVSSEIQIQRSLLTKQDAVIFFWGGGGGGGGCLFLVPTILTKVMFTNGMKNSFICYSFSNHKLQYRLTKFYDN